jgi:hypothetical protein
VTSFSQLPCYLISPYAERLGHGGSSRVVVVACNVGLIIMLL